MVDARVLGRLDKWNGNREAWANWSFVMKAHDRAVNQQVSEEVKISADVVSNVQLGCVQLHLVLIMSCAGGDWIASQTLHEAGVQKRGDFSFRRFPRRTMQGWAI